MEKYLLYVKPSFYPEAYVLEEFEEEAAAEKALAELVAFEDDPEFYLEEYYIEYVKEI